jgi:hypothetical protein
MIVFDAMCLKCGKRQGIELPNTMQAIIACSTAEQLSWDKRCECGGAVEVITYEGKLDKDRNVIC